VLPLVLQLVVVASVRLSSFYLLSKLVLMLLGGVIYPVIFRHLQPRIGFAWTIRIMALIMLATMGVAISITRLRELPMRPRPLLDLNAFKSRSFSLYSTSQFFTFGGVFIPFFYIQQYSQERGNISADLSFYVLSLMNAGSMFGRIIPGMVADRIGTMNTLIICGPITLVLVFSWVVIHSTAGILVFSIMYGFASGGFVSLQAPTVAHMCPELENVGTWLGMVAFVSGLGILIGSPVSGVILAHGSWTGLKCLSGAFTLIGIAFILAARCVKSGTQIMIKS
jgi:predicted MFS family arabinose efflux permease